MLQDVCLDRMLTDLSEDVPENFNAGFMMFAPSIDMFNYYVSYLGIKDSFDPRYPEQNLLNLVHKWGGPMPWQEL